MTAVRRGIVATLTLSAGIAGLSSFSRGQTREGPAPGQDAEFHFLRLEYVDQFRSRRGWGSGRGWWMQDWPAAEVHFEQGLRRLTRIDTGEGRHLPLTDDRIFDYPWIYATQVGFWDLRDAETDRLREYDIKERTQIPGLRHLRRGPGGATFVQPQATPPIWRAIRDDQGRVVVAINFHMDIGDAWEHADMPEYPEPMTALAYRFGINYVVYAMTH